MAVICIIATTLALSVPQSAFSQNPPIKSPQTDTPVLRVTAFVKDPLYDAKVAWIEEVSKCEDSTGNPEIRVLDTNGRYSYGVMQFQMQTWLSMGKKYGIETTPENITDALLQKELAMLILNDGGWNNWYICGNRTTKKLGKYPVG